MGDVHAGDAAALPVVEQGLEKLALAAAEIDDAARARLPERPPDRCEALVVQTERALETLLLLLMRRFVAIACPDPPRRRAGRAPRFAR